MASQDMITREVLVAARKLIEKPEHWTQGQLARGRADHPCSPISLRARQWCAGGACKRAAFDTGACGYGDLYGLLSEHAPLPLTIFNDQVSHRDVLALFDRVIESLPLDRETVS